MKIILVKTISRDQGPCLAPAWDSDRAKLAKLKTGEQYQFTLGVQRNMKQMRKLFAIMRIVVSNSREHPGPLGEPVRDFENEEQVLQWVKLKAGHTRILKVGETFVQYAGSIACENMTQEDFDKFFQRALEIMAEYMGLTPEELSSNAYEYM